MHFSRDLSVQGSSARRFKTYRRKRLFKQLDKELMEKAVFAPPKKSDKKLDKLFSTKRSSMLRDAIGVDQSFLLRLIRKVSELCFGRDTLARFWHSRAEESQLSDRVLQSGHHGCIALFLLSLFLPLESTGLRQFNPTITHSPLS